MTPLSTLTPQLHVNMPVVQHPSPYWVDPATNVNVPSAPSPNHSYHYIAVQTTPSPVPGTVNTIPTPTSITQPSITPTSSSLENVTPRPRKPYTTTKVREMWSANEHERMLEGLRLYKRDWAKVTQYVGTRSPAQVRSHAQKYFDKVARDKTDEYVPRARPKRKSTNPYPRKIRDDSQQQRVQNQNPIHPSKPFQQIRGEQHPMQQHTIHAPSSLPSTMNQIPFSVPTGIPIQTLQNTQTLQAPVIHHAPISMIGPPQIPMLTQMHTSPYLTTPQQTVTIQQAVSPHMYQPSMMNIYHPSPNPDHIHTPVQHATPSAQASPMSYINGNTYSTHASPVPQHAASLAFRPHTVYPSISPITPSTFSPNVAKHSGLHHPNVSLVSTPTHQSNVPIHSHPNGPLENCSKCIALQRYGNVLQELGQFSRPSIAPPGTTMVADKPMKVPSNQMATPSNQEGKTSTDQNKIKEQSKEVSGASVGRKSNYGGSTPSESEITQKSPELADESTLKVQRSPVKRQDKSEKQNSLSHVTKTQYTSDTGSSTRNCDGIKVHNERTTGRNGKKRPRNKDANPRERTHKRQKGSVISQSSKGAKQVNGICETPNKKQICSPSKNLKTSDKEAYSCSDDGCEPVLLRSKSKDEMSKEESDRIRSSLPSSASPSQESCEKKRGQSPIVGTYSPKEQKEIFDAVHSLQILAKTSSPSGSEKSSDEKDNE